MTQQSGPATPEAPGASEAHDEPDSQAPGEGESPEQLPVRAWATLILFAVFVVAFGSCASTFMFN